MIYLLHMNQILDEWSGVEWSDKEKKRVKMTEKRGVEGKKRMECGDRTGTRPGSTVSGSMGVTGSPCCFG